MTNQLRTLLPNKDIFIHAVCDVDTRRLKEVAVDVLRAYRRDLNEYGKCMSTQDHNEIMARDDIDGVVVATPVHWNAAITLDAIRSGKDVLCQSPMTLTVREGQLVQRAAAQHGAIVQCRRPTALRAADGSGCVSLSAMATSARSSRSMLNSIPFRNQMRFRNRSHRKSSTMTAGWRQRHGHTTTQPGSRADA